MVAPGSLTAVFGVGTSGSLTVVCAVGHSTDSHGGGGHSRQSLKLFSADERARVIADFTI